MSRPNHSILSRRRAITVCLSVFVVLALLGWWWHSRQPHVPTADLLRQARIALAAGNYESASKLSLQVLERSPGHTDGLLLAGEAAMKAQRYDDALEYFRAVPLSSADESIAALFSAAEVSRAMGHLADAERDYEAVLMQRPGHLPARERLAFILDLQGRRWEASSHLLELLRQDQISYSTLIRLGTRDSAVPADEALDAARRANRDQAAVKLADAVNLQADHRPEEARSLLEEAIRLQPKLVEAHARLGLILVDRDPGQLPRWQQRLPVEADTHPDVWVARGLWAQQEGQSQAAMRCYWEAAVLDPNQRVAQYRLGQLLAGTEFDEEALELSERSRLLQKLAALIHRLVLQRNDVSAMQATAAVLEQLGRYWEAYGWCGMILISDPAQDDVRRRMQALHRRLSSEVHTSGESFDPATAIDLSHLPLPVWPSSTTKPTPRQSTDDAGDRIRFADRAADALLNFTYYNGGNPSTPGTKMYQFSGGGIAVLDYDGDNLPDLYLTQGCDWPPETESTMHRDRLFRNLGDGTFRNVTSQSGLGDGWFSQGATVGDLDNDGWPDLYVANIGRNRLYRNNGDGTFDDVTERMDKSESRWTTSCLLADLNGDGFADIYDVNYVAGDDVFERTCRIQGEQRACAPNLFESERDEILINQRDGEFLKLSGPPASALEPPRPGLGIVAADMNGTGRLDLFLANDAVANAFLVNETVSNGDQPSFRENALLAGLAFDRDGRAQACMGVAAGDVDGNGLLDLFVTNYYQEANSLYLQTAPEAFTESSRPARLFDAGFLQLGFGAQFLDADLDGRLDLVVANGHLDDFRHMQIPYRMPPQFFRNAGDGQFQEAEASKIGNYFSRKLLGRSLAVLDWNGDGRPDFAVSHLETPVALVTNETQQPGHWIKLRLHGTASSRDAIGTIVRVECAAAHWTQQLTAGDGYQASNERMLLFGLAGSTEIDRLTIRWPSGLTQSFAHIAVDRDLAVTEGAGQLLELPAPGRSH